MIRDRGFTLLEVLVSFVILALVLGVVLRIFSDGLQNAARLSNYERAVIYAESQLARVGAEIPLEEGVEKGELSNAFRWQRSIRLHDVEKASDQAVAPLPVRLFDVDIEVGWGDVDSRVVHLHTLRLGALP
ncbi:MAG: prepilin-type N-terminal cleavage/methylation domain-containing protein [Mariprofundaceae bacterium]